MVWRGRGGGGRRGSKDCLEAVWRVRAKARSAGVGGLERRGVVGLMMKSVGAGGWEWRGVVWLMGGKGDGVGEKVGDGEGLMGRGGEGGGMAVSRASSSAIGMVGDDGRREEEVEEGGSGYESSVVEAGEFSGGDKAW